MFSLRRNTSGLLRRCNVLSSHNHFSSAASNPFQGVWPIIATPFNNDETINYQSFERIINFFSNEIGVNGCTITGVLGESNRLIDAERKELISIATSISSKPICVGTSHSGTYATMKLSEQAMQCGAHSVMITPSKEPVPDQSSVIEYYTKIYQGLGDDVPVVLQDHPASTMVHMTMDSMKTIIRECPSVKCVKLESVPTPPRIRQLAPWLREDGHDVSILTGLGALYGLFDLEANTDPEMLYHQGGFMTGFAFPEILYALYEQQILLGNNLNAKLLYQKYLPLMVFEQQPGVALRKEIYKLRGLMDSSYCRHPGKNSNPAAVEQLKDCIDFVIGKDVDLTKPLSITVPKQKMM